MQPPTTGTSYWPNDKQCIHYSMINGVKGVKKRKPAIIVQLHCFTTRIFTPFPARNRITNNLEFGLPYTALLNKITKTS